jgi:glycosyltransferase involved in cell wall biosynthesis
MALLHLLGSAADGGAETYFTSLVCALHRGGVSSAAALRAHEVRRAVLAQAGVPTAVFGFGGPLDWRTRGRVAAYAKQREASVLLAWMNRAARHCPEGPWMRMGRLGGYYDLKNYRGFNALVANTVDIRDWIVAQGWPPEHVHHIPNFAEAAKAMPLDRSAFDTPEKAPLLLGMGRLHPSKAHDVTLKALTRLPDAWLWIAGSGPLQRELEKLARDLGVAERVRFLGWRDDASALYRTVDAVLFPSRFEPLGNVVIQAWAHGVPIAAAASKGPAALIYDGEDGLLVPVDDPDALARAARRLIDDKPLRFALIECGRKRVRQEFSREVVVERWRGLVAAYGES